MIGTLLYVFGSCERHSELAEEMKILLRLIPKEDSSLLMFLYISQGTEISRPKYLTHGRQLSCIYFVRKSESFTWSAGAGVQIVA